MVKVVRNYGNATFCENFFLRNRPLCEMRQAPSDHGERHVKTPLFPRVFFIPGKGSVQKRQVGTAGDRNSLKNKDTQEIEADIKYICYMS